MKYLLDTNTCIRVLNASGAATLVERWKAAHASQIRLCSVVKAELLFGAEKSSKRDLVLQKLQIFFSRFKSMPFDDAAAQTYGAIRAALEKEGRPIDMLIAAIRGAPCEIDTRLVSPTSLSQDRTPLQH